MVSYKTVMERVDSRIIVNKSKFIGIILPCSSVLDFDEQLAAIKKEYNDASHHCYAYRITENILLERYQDDKEPSGTAGIPILEVLKGQDISECGIVVVRYFGGTKLGTGGLSRAYSDTARQVLDLADLVRKEEATYIRLEVDYHVSGKIDNYLNVMEIPLIETDYQNNVIYTLAVPKSKVGDFQNEINDLTSGQGQFSNIKNVVGYFNKKQFIPNEEKL